MNILKKTWMAFGIFTLLGCQHGFEGVYFGSYSDAEALFKRHQYAHAIQKYQAYIDENPESDLAVTSSYYMARSYAALGRTDEARALFEKIIQEHPDYVWANFSETRLKNLPPAESTSASR